MNNDYQFKNQTPEHKTAMKLLCEQFMEETGCTPDEIIDAGDYLLNEMTLEELKGEKSVKPSKENGAEKSAGSKSGSKNPKGKAKDKSSKKSGKGKSKKKK